jgi:hypothetical protein
MATSVEHRAVTLTAADRCDRCSARAVVETVMLGGGSLFWCGHHYGRYSEALSSFGAQIVVDERDS